MIDINCFVSLIALYRQLSQLTDKNEIDEFLTKLREDASQLPSVIEWKTWQEEFLEDIEKKIMKNPNLLDSEMRNYIVKARFQVYNVFRSPPTACIMGEYVGYAIRFFADLEQSVFKMRIDLKDYYHSMSELLAMYCDLRVNALLLYKDRLDETRQQFLHMLRQFLANNCDYITNALLRIQRLKVSRQLFENMFKFVEQNANFEKTHSNCVSYCRYILFYRQWKKMYSDIMILREISARAVERLKPPPNFRKHKLFEMLRPKNSAIPPNLTLFFLTAPIHTNLAVDKFFSVDKYESETPAPDDLYEVVDLTDEVQSPKREDESLEQVNRTTNNRCTDDTYNLTLSFNNLMNVERQTITQQTTNITQSTPSQSTSLSSFLHRNDQLPSWSPITRNLITNSNKDNQESIDTGIFSDRSSGNSPAYEMEVKDVNVITSTPSSSVNDKVITRVISSSCDKCGHKSSSSIVDVLPSSSIQQQMQGTKSSISSSHSKTSVIVILDDEEDEHTNKNFDQGTQPIKALMDQPQQDCSQNKVVIPDDEQNDVILVTSECSNNEKSITIEIEEVIPPSSCQKIEELNTSHQVECTSNINDNKLPSTTLSISTISSELCLNASDDNNMTNIDNLTQTTDNSRTLNIKKTNLKDVGVSTHDITDSEHEMHENVLNSSSDDSLIKKDNNNKVRVMSVINVTPNTCVDNDSISNLEQPSLSTNEVSDTLRITNTFTIDQSAHDPIGDGQSNHDDEENVQDATSMNVDVVVDGMNEEDIDTDMDTQQFVDQMFCSKSIELINNKKHKKQKNDNKDNDKSHCELTSYIKSPPQNDNFFYGFSNNNNNNHNHSGSDLSKSQSNNNNTLSPSLFQNNNDHSQCSIHLQNATRLTEEFVSTTRTRDQQTKHKQNINTNTANNKINKNTKSILKTNKKSHSNNVSNKKKSVVLSKDSYTRYIHEDENNGHNHHHHHRKHQNGTSSSSVMQMLGGPSRKHGGSIIIAENHYDKPEEHIRRYARYQHFREYQHCSFRQHEDQEERRVLRQRSESRDMDPFSQYLHPTCRDAYPQPKDRENGPYYPRRRNRSHSMSERSIHSCKSSLPTESSPSKRARFSSFNEYTRLTRSRSIDQKRSLEDKSLYKNMSQNVQSRSNVRNRAKTISEEEKQLLYEKLRRKYNILKQVQIILNERNNLTIESYKKKLAEDNSFGYHKKSENLNDISSRDSEELTHISSNDHRKSRLNRRSSSINDGISERRRGRSRTRIKRNQISKEIEDSTEKSNSVDRLTPVNSESKKENNTPTTSTESMYLSTMYFSTPVRIAEFVESLQASTTTAMNSNTLKNGEIRVPSIQSSIERLQNSLASPISLPATESSTDIQFNDSNLNSKKFNSIKSGNLTKSNVVTQMKIEDKLDEQDVQEDDDEIGQNLDDLTSDVNINERSQLRTKGARKLLKDEMNRPMRQCRRSSSTNNRIFSTDTSSTRRLRKTEYLKTFRHVTGDIEEEQSTNEEVTTTTAVTSTVTATSTVTSTLTITTVSDSKLSWEHYINLSPEKQQVSIVDNNGDDDESNHNIYDELSKIAQTSEHSQINNVDKNDKLSESTDSQHNSMNNNCIEISNTATPMMMSIAALDQLQNNTRDSVTLTMDNITPCEESNHHLDVVPSPLNNDIDNVCNSNKLEQNVSVINNDVNSIEAISNTQCSSSTTVPILSPILSNSKRNDERTLGNKTKKSLRKVTFIENNDNIDESTTNLMIKNNNKNSQENNNLSLTSSNKIINDDQTLIMMIKHNSTQLNNNKKITQITNKKISEIKSSANLNSNKKHQIKQLQQQPPTTNHVKSNKQLKTTKKDLSTSSKDVSSKLRFFDIFEEIDHQQKDHHLLIPNVRKRRLLSCTTAAATTTTTNSYTNSSVSVNTTVISSDEDDDISLAELKRRNVVLIKKDTNSKHLNSKFKRGGGKSYKNCDIINNVHLSGTNTTSGANTSVNGAIVLTLDEIETCDISVVSCEEVVGEGTILLNNANAIHKPVATTNNK